MNGQMLTVVYCCSSCCLRGSYLASLAWAASSRAVGQPSNGQDTSTIVTVESSGEMIVRSGLLFPLVPGMDCSFILVPMWSGIALTIRSKMVLCCSLAIPRFWWQWLRMWASVSGTLPHILHNELGTVFLQRSCTVLTGSRFSLALWMKRY